jgi:glycosyltransferase involved in cell wall biosynthesis
MFKVITSSITFNKSTKYEFEGVNVHRIAQKFLLPFFERKSNYSIIRFLGKAFHFFKDKFSIDFILEGLPVFWILLQNHSEYDVIHIFGKNNTTGAAILFAKCFKKPLIIELVNLEENPHHPLPRTLNYIWGNRFPSDVLIVCISKRLSDMALKNGYSQEKIWCRPNPVDVDKFTINYANKYALRQSLLGLDKEKILILHLAKFMPLKNQSFVVDVLSCLPENFHCVMVGPLVDSGPLKERDQNYFSELIQKINTLGISERINIQNRFVENPEQYMQASDIVLVPSTTEACGTPALEAVACGIPVIVNNIPGVFDQWIEEGVSGYICDLEPKKWAECIIKAIEIKREHLLKARKKVIENCSVTVIDENYRSILLKVANG